MIKNMNFSRLLFAYVMALLLLINFGKQSFASDATSEKFDAGKFVMEEVSDTYEWHIMDIGKHHISIPLPIILYSEYSGMHIFMSSKFHHGNESYKGFSWEKEGENENKIIETLQTGDIYIPWNFSITKVVVGIIVSVIIMLYIFLSVAKSMRERKNKAPKGMQNAMEVVINFVKNDIAVPCIGENKYEKFMPYLLTVFFFILINNIIGLIPIVPMGANVTGNISVTLCLAMFTFIVVNMSGNKHYWKEIYNPDVPWWMKFPIPLMPIVELMGVFTKPVVLMVRLFANILAGHMVIGVFVALIFVFTNLMGVEYGAMVSPVSVLLSVFIKLLDVLVSFIQAFVFTLLSALYIGMATSEHH